MAPTKVRTLRVGDEVWAKWGDAAAARGESIAERVHRAMLALEKVEAMATLPDMRLLGTDAQAEDFDGHGVPDPTNANAGSEPATPDSLRDLAQGRRLKRTGLCEHRVPPTSHCSRCDP